MPAYTKSTYIKFPTDRGEGLLEVVHGLPRLHLPAYTKATYIKFPTDRGEGLLEVVGSDDAVLVGVDDAEGLLELLDLLLAEEREDVGARLLGLLTLGRLPISNYNNIYIYI